MPEPMLVPVASSKAKRRLLLLAGVGSILLVTAILVLPWLVRQAIGPLRLRAVVEDALSEALHRKVTILGDVSLIVVPWFGLSIGPLSMADAPGFGPSPMLSAAHTEVTIRILPLLARVVSTGSVRVQGLTLHLRREASGRSNWDDLTSPPGQTTQVPAGWQVAPQPRDIRVTGASVSYLDQTTGRDWTFTDTQLFTGLGQPFNFSLAFRARGPVPGASLECRAQGNASLDQVTGLPIPRSAHLTTIAHFTSPLVPGGASPVSILSHTTLTYDPDRRTLDLKDLDAQLPGVRLTGSARVTQATTAPRAEATLTLTADLAGGWRDILGLSPNGDQPNLTAPAGGEPTSREPVVAPNESLTAEKSAEAGQAVLTVAVSADTAALTLREAQLRLPRGTASATGTVVFGETPVLDLSLSAEGLDSDDLPPNAGQDVWSLPANWLSRWRVDARLDLRRCVVSGLPVKDFHATVKSGNGHARLYPVSAVLPEGLASLDARLDSLPDGLAVDIQAGVDPLPDGGNQAPLPSRARVQGRWGADGAKGTFVLQSPDPGAAGRVLGLAGLSAEPLECRGGFAATTGSRRPIRHLALTDLNASLAGTLFHGQLSWDEAAPLRLSFDLAADTLDVDKLAAITGPTGGGTGLRADGKVRVDRLTVRGIEAQNTAGTLTLADGRFETVLTGGELFGGRLSGKANGDASGRIGATVQLAGADAAKLPGNLQLAGPITAKATLETNMAKDVRPRTLQVKVEAEASRLEHGRAPDRLSLGSPKAVLTLTGRDTPAGGDDLPLDASLTVTNAAGGGLRDIRLAVSGPLVMDATGRLREGGPAKLEASALWPGGIAPGRDLKLSLAGPLTLDLADGSFAAGDLRADIGGLPATVKIGRKAGEASRTTFSLETGPRPPRQVLTGWGLDLPKGLAADRLTKGSLSLSGTAGEAGLDINRLTLALDDTTLGGRANFPKFDFKRGKWELSVDRLDWDAYFPPAAKTTPEERRKPFDLRLLRDLALDARLTAGWLKRGNVTFGATTITASARGGVFSYRQESPQFYGGRFFAEIRGDARGPALAAMAELKLEGFECASFMRDWADGDTLNSGSATFILASRARGISEAELRETLTGNARLQITRGDFNIHDGHKPSEKAPPETVPFDVFSSSWLGREGVARTDDFTIESPKMQVRGKGQVDLRNETIDLSVMATLHDGSQAAATISGPLDDPKLAIDRSKMLGDMLYRVLQGIISIPGRTVTHIFQLR